MKLRAGSDRIELGLGLVSLGRPWGVRNTEPPNEADAATLLIQAIELGIRVFDTAPAYGTSEERLGLFLKRLTSAQCQNLVIMTKAGEQWDATNGSRTNHTADGLRRSIDRSLALLGRVDVLQIHKASADVVNRPGVRAAIEYARSVGISHFGASVSDLQAGRLALGSGLFDALQFPLNANSNSFHPLLPEMAALSVVPVINRPFAMGGLVQQGAFAEQAQAAFAFIRGQTRKGIVLTGTSKAAHLAANLAAFRAATEPAN